MCRREFLPYISENMCHRMKVEAQSMSNSAIGIFDSGLGGLTAVKQLKKVMPKENIVYFGDTAVG